MPTMPADPEEVSSPLYKRWGVPPQVVQHIIDITKFPRCRLLVVRSHYPSDCTEQLPDLGEIQPSCRLSSSGSFG